MKTVKNLLLLTAAAAVWTAFGADFAVQVRNGVPQFTKDGVPFSNQIFYAQVRRLVMRQFNYVSGSRYAIEMAHDIAGVRLISYGIYLDWPKPGESVEKLYREADILTDAVIKAAPDAYLLPRFQLKPSPWWLEAHPDDAYKDHTNIKREHYFNDGDVTSPRYREDAKKMMLLLVRHLEKRYPGKIAGYHPAGQATGEWNYVGGHLGTFFSYSKSNERAFRTFVKKKYGTEAALRKAWNQPAVTFNTVTIPDAKVCAGDPQKPLREPATDQYLLDYIDFINTALADFVLDVCRTLRQEFGRTRLIGGFFGYWFEFAGLPNGFGWSGHAQLRRLLESPDIDFIAAPMSYKDRTVTEHCTTMSPAESIMMAGKVWLNEDDTTTDLAFLNARHNWAGGGQGARSKEETLSMLPRNLSYHMQHNFAFWWMDLMDIGWWNDPDYWKVMKAFRPLEAKILQKPLPYRPPVAFVADGKAQSYLLARFPKPVPMFHEIGQRFMAQGPQQLTLGHTMHFHHGRFRLLGVDYGQYMLDDVLAGKVNTQLNVYYGLFALNGQQRQKLAALRKEKASLWGWGSGWIDLDTGRGSLKAVEETTGFAVRHATKHATQEVYATETGRKKYHLPENFGTPCRVEPLLTPVLQPGDEVLATYGDGFPAIVVRKGKKLNVFYGVSEVPFEFYAVLGKLAGLEPVTTPFAHTYRTEYFCTVQVPKAGLYTIRHGYPNGAKDFFTGKTVSDGPVAKLTVKPLETVVLVPIQ